MKKIIHGQIYKFGNNIDTDQIYPGCYLDITEPSKIAKYVLEGADPTFHKRFVKGGIIIGGTNFGCGSSREHAVIALKTAGVSLLIADSFARIFYRNCINLCLPLLICPDISKKLNEGDSVVVNLETGIIKTLTDGEEYQGQQLSDYVMSILQAGGIKSLLKSKLFLK